MIKIAHVNAVYGKSSTGLILKDIHTLCLSDGFDSVVCASIGEAHIRIGNRLEGTLHAILTRLLGLQGFGSYFSTLCFIRRLRKFRPDIIHLHNIHNNCLYLPIFFNYIKSNQIPIVLTLHDSWFFTGKCYHFLDIGCEKWKTLCHQCPKRYEEIPSYMADMSSYVFKKKQQLFDYYKLFTVGCSKWITSCAKESPILRTSNFYQIYNGVDTKIFNPEGPRYQKLLHSDEFTIMVMANKWFSASNKELVSELIRVLPQLGNLLIIGCTNKQKSLYQGNGNIQCLGFIHDREQLAALYRSSDVFLNVTQVDTLPTVNMEAACCGTPVVTYDSGGSGELVVNGNTGYVVQKNNISEIICSLFKVKEGHICRKVCSDWALSEFDRNITYQRYIHLYRDIKKYSICSHIRKSVL